jgi:hypothetical protein
MPADGLSPRPFAARFVGMAADRSLSQDSIGELLVSTPAPSKAHLSREASRNTKTSSKRQAAKRATPGAAGITSATLEQVQALVSGIVAFDFAIRRVEAQFGLAK